MNTSIVGTRLSVECSMLGVGGGGKEIMEWNSGMEW